MFILYDLIFLIFTVCYIPYAIVKGKWHKGFFFRLGFIPQEIKERLTNEKNIWVHAVSVGEILAVENLIKKLKTTFTGYQIVCSTVTKTGFEIASKQLKDHCQVIYSPLDFSCTVNKFIRIIHPKIYIATETELWPNLYTFLNKNKVPIVLINGRISDKSYGRYSLVRFLTAKILSFVNIFCMQSELDAKRIASLGAPKEKVRIIGNLKFDNLPYEIILNQNDLGFNEDDNLFIAGSTHPGEDEIFIKVLETLSDEFPRLRLVICPRHVERSAEVAQLIRQHHLEPVLYSQIKNAPLTEKSVVVVDSVGQLRNLYGRATIVFIGKTFKVGGGQNMIEPAFFGKPVLVGPLTENFKDVMEIFLKESAIIQVGDPDELCLETANLLRDPKRMGQIGSAAKGVVQKYQGATARTLESISELLNSK